MYHYLILSLFSFSIFSCLSPEQNSVKLSNDNNDEQWEDQLIHVQKTHRISSNHFSDIVLDSTGNAYIAYFEKTMSGSDEIRLTKLDPGGNWQWKQGSEQKGRAMAIAMDRQQHIWITGIFEQKLEFGAFKLNQKSGIFIAQFDQNGNCLNLIGSQEHGIASDIAINSNGEILIGGKMGSQLSFGNTNFENASNKDQSFLALFSSNLECKWIKPMEGQIRRIRSHPDNSFFVGGSFYSRFSYQTDTIYTKDGYDQDGFLLQILPDKQEHRLEVYGREGSLKKGYRSSEGISDIAISSTGMVAIALFEEPSNSFQIAEKENSIPLWIYILEDGQNSLYKFQATASHQGRSISTLAFENDSTLWLSGKQYNKDVYRSFLSKIYLKKDRFNIPKIDHGPNMLFRSMDFKHGKLAAAGHFQDSLIINNNKIENNGEHSLFYYSIKMDTNHAKQH